MSNVCEYLSTSVICSFLPSFHPSFFLSSFPSIHPSFLPLHDPTSYQTLSQSQRGQTPFF